MAIKKSTVFLHALAFVSTSLFVLMQLYDPPWVREYVESLPYDLRMYVKTFVKHDPPPEEVVIVTVDEKSIAKIGRWPWPREVMARLVDTVSKGDPRSIGIDILFTEPENERSDQALAQALERAGNVTLATAFLVSPLDQSGEVVPDQEPPAYLWDHAFMSVKGTKEFDWMRFVVKSHGVLVPLEPLAAQSALGSVYTLPDRDGVIRSEILYVHYADDFYGSLPLHVARRFMGVEPDQVEVLAGKGVQLGDTMIATDLSGRVLINYYGAEGTFNYYPAVDVMEGRVSPETFKGKAVLIGTSAVATYDQKVTPLSANMPGVEKNATVIANILEDNFIRKSPGVIEMVVTVLAGIILSLAMGRLRAIRAAILALSLMVAYVLAASYLFMYYRTWLNITYPTLNMAVIFLAQSTIKYFLEERQSRQMRSMFSSYVSPKVVEALIANPEMARLGGQKKEVTVLFSDIAGFTSFSERLEPEQVVSLLNEYFKEMTDCIIRWDGTFDKIVGDEIMAFWGAPVDQPNHPELAVRCALDMVATLRKLHVKWTAEGKPLLNFGIGLNTGMVLVGNIGAEGKKMDYTIIGDHVNAGARVEALTRKYNATILITQFTKDRVADLFETGKIGHASLEYRDSVKVKGKEIELQIFEMKELGEEPPAANEQ